MKISEREQNGAAIFDLAGRIDSEGAIDLDLALQTASGEGKCKLILDFTQVQYINSAGLRILADLLTQAKEKDGDLKLVNPSPKVKRVFQIIGFDRFFSIYDTIDEAIAAF